MVGVVANLFHSSQWLNVNSVYVLLCVKTQNVIIKLSESRQLTEKSNYQLFLSKPLPVKIFNKNKGSQEGKNIATNPLINIQQSIL